MHEYHQAQKPKPVKGFSEGSRHGKLVAIQNGDACKQNFLAKVLQNVIMREAEDTAMFSVVFILFLIFPADICLMLK